MVAWGSILDWTGNPGTRSQAFQGLEPRISGFPGHMDLLGTIGEVSIPTSARLRRNLNRRGSGAGFNPGVGSGLTLETRIGWRAGVGRGSWWEYLQL